MISGRDGRSGAGLLALAACGFVALAILTAAVMSGRYERLDVRVLLLFRDPSDPLYPIGPGWLESSVRDVTNLGGPALVALVTAAGAGFCLVTGRRRDAWWLLTAVIGSFLICTGMKLALARPGPAFLPHAVPTDRVAFPSGHATSATATYLTLAHIAARRQPGRAASIYLWSLGGLLALAIGLSRVYLGTHWPSDVLGGWILGGSWALGCGWVAMRSERVR